MKIFAAVTKKNVELDLFLIAKKDFIYLFQMLFVKRRVQFSAILGYYLLNLLIQIFISTSVKENNHYG